MRFAIVLDQKDSGAAAESAEIVDIGEMSDEQSVGVKSGKRKPEPMHPAPG